MTSSEHCRTRQRALTRGRSARLSDRKVTRAKLLGDFWIGHAEGIGQLLAQFRPVGIAHDDGGHGLRPAHVIGVKKVEELVDLRSLKPPV